MTLTSRRVLLVLGALVAGLAIAACGSSNSSTTTSAAAGSTTSTNPAARRAALLACLRQHGVNIPNRPAGAPPPGGFRGGGGFFRGAASNPKMRAAFQACGANFRFRGGGFRLSHTRINNYVACIRKNGYPQMPNPNFSGKGPVFPASVRSNQKFQAASRACQSVLIPRGAPGAGGSTNST